MKRNFSLTFYLFLLLFAAFFVQACGTAPKPHDYNAYLSHMPVSILVLPPRNESTEVMAPYIYLSTVTRPLAERGYYVFPVAVIDMLMKENGVPSPDEMAQVSLKKIREIINPDAVLYMTVKEWGTKYKVLNSTTTVCLSGQLVDTETGIVLWQGEYRTIKNSSDGQQGIIAMLVSAVIHQIVNTISDPTRDLAQLNNERMFLNERNGLLLGKRHSQFESDQRSHREIMNRTAAESNP
ncbi:MAG: GNA1162 family protein [Pseudomonadota bacterium]